MIKAIPKRARVTLLVLFLLIEAALAVSLQITDGMTSRVLSYLLVVLAFLTSLSFVSRDKARIATVLALAFTLLADFNLVILNSHYDIAMSFFSITQLSYAARLYIEADSAVYRRTQVIVRSSVSLIAIILPIIVLGDGADYLSIISVFYFANLLLNTVFAFVTVRKNWIFAVGLLLFCFCDVFVGFSQLGGYISIEPGSFAWWLAHPGFNAAWVFYAPSQVLLSLSHIETRRTPRMPSDTTAEI